MLEKQGTKVPLYIQLRNELMKRVVSGQYKAEEKLPTEHELMEHFNVGRATVRAALSELEREGYIYTRHGIGSFVSNHSKSIGIQPMISLSYFLNRMGIVAQNRVIIDEKIKVDDVLTSRWEKGKPIYHIQRWRYADKYPVAIEDSYFLPAYYKKLTASDKEQSLSKALISKGKALEMERLELIFHIRNSKPEEAKILKLASGAKVVELTRWIYEKDQKKPINFVRFVIAEKILEYPFSSI